MIATEYPLKLPLWKAAVEDAERDGLLDYNSMIPREWLESHFLAKWGTVAFMAEIIPFRAALKARGWFTSARGQQGIGYLILPPQDVADHVKSEILRSARRSAANAAGMNQVNISALEPEQQAKHYTVTAKASLFHLLGMRLVRGRKALPGTPEMTMKTIRNHF